ncbi:uncharacterized protein LOC122679549 [Cervus elaphus]|uniref:uncharacterized protein LOC122679549 n=1 Tax=Cervus elaphus TaxID=9860 RepID=UPI001CC309C2|nr:uncharacterized protein LOC122679549 [Cervus elaphus]XP_043736281.1 uncharacterized protein LOC122679549 [Cervus elaphus]
MFRRQRGVFSSVPPHLPTDSEEWCARSQCSVQTQTTGPLPLHLSSTQDSGLKAAAAAAGLWKACHLTCSHVPPRVPSGVWCAQRPPAAPPRPFCSRHRPSGPLGPPRARVWSPAPRPAVQQVMSAGVRTLGPTRRRHSGFARARAPDSAVSSGLDCNSQGRTRARLLRSRSTTFLHNSRELKTTPDYLDHGNSHTIKKKNNTQLCSY